MISLPSGTRIWLVAGVTDMRKSFNSTRKYLACYLSGLCAIWSASCRLLKVLVS
jgi:transposase